MIFEIVLAVFALVVAIFAIYVVLDRKKIKVVKMTTMALLERYGKVKQENGHLFFSTKTEKYEVLFFKVPTNSELTINSKVMWEIITGTTSRVVDQSSFLASEYSKLIMIYPSTQVIKRYINENEMVFVKPTDYFYNFRLIRDFELETILKEGTL